MTPHDRSATTRLPPEAVSTRLEALGRLARERDMSPQAQQDTRARAAALLAPRIPAPGITWRWAGALARAAAVLILVGGSLLAITLTLRSRRAHQGRQVAAARAAALDPRIEQMQEDLEAQLWRFRERYAPGAHHGGVLAMRTRELGSRIAVYRTELQGEIERAEQWSLERRQTHE